MTEHQLTKSELAARELIFLRAADAMNTFASEQAERRPEREVPAEPLAAFAPEGFIHAPDVFTHGPEAYAHPIRSSVPLASRRPLRRFVLTALGVAMAVSVFFLVERSAERVSPPIAPSEPSPLVPEVNAPTPVPPVVVADVPQPVVEAPQPPSPSPVVPEIEAAPPRPVLPVTPRTAPPRAASPSSSRSRPLPSTPPVTPPRSQAPTRVAGVPAPSPSRPRDVGRNAAVPAPVASVAPPIADPAPSPSAAPPASAALSPPAAPPASAALAPSPTTALPAPAPSPTAPAAPASVSPSAVEANTSGIQNTLARYRKAFSALDASAAHQVWPTVNERTLQRAFARLEQQEVSFEGCRIAADLERAQATCVGTARYVPRVGSRTPRIDRREWRFSLVKVRDEWLIGAVDAQ